MLSTAANVAMGVMNDKVYPFCVINKSYIKDLYWSMILYRSWIKFSEKKTPYIIIVPESDVHKFNEEFSRNFINETPVILSQEDLLNYVGIKIPGDFTGWHTQQIIKLGFARTRWAEKYLALDSAMIFCKTFDWEVDLTREGKFSLVYGYDDRAKFYSYLDSVHEKTWLRGGLVSARLSYEEIDKILRYDGNVGAWYATSMVFDSVIVNELDEYLSDGGIDGIVGAIKIAPYEYRWYGTYLMSNYMDSIFKIHDDYFKPIISNASAEELMSNKMRLDCHQIGYLFQPPASEYIDSANLFSNGLTLGI